MFNNKEILIDGHTIFYSKWFEKEIISIQDILDHTGKFLTWHEFQNKYGVKCNFLNYLQVLSAIPKHLLQKARTLSPIDKRNLLHNTIYQLSPSITRDLAKMRCKDYYWLYINAVKIEPTGPKKWVKDLNLKNFDWKRAFPQISQVCKENKLREFNFNKLLHRIIVTSKALKRVSKRTVNAYTATNRIQYYTLT